MMDRDWLFVSLEFEKKDDSLDWREMRYGQLNTSFTAEKKEAYKTNKNINSTYLST